MKTTLLSIALLPFIFCKVNAQAPAFSHTQSKPSAVFEENKGQMKDQHWNPRPDVLFYGNQEGMNYYIKNNGVSFQLSRVDSWCEESEDQLMQGKPMGKRPDQVSTYRVDAEWINHNHDFSAEREKALDGYNNYYNVPDGVEPALFVKQYESVTLKNVWNGIDIHYYGTNAMLETDYLVAPGADYRDIKFQIKGAELSTTADGHLVMKTPFGEIHEGELKVFQGEKRLVGHWVIGKDNIVSFEIPDYNPALALRIDPLTRAWGTYYGGGENEADGFVRTDIFGNVFIAGLTSSPANISSGGHQNTFGGDFDSYMTKFNDSGLRIWSTYYGGSLIDYTCAVSNIQQGFIYISGYTNSLNNISSNGFQNSLTGLSDAFLVKFDSLGIRQWGTYYGGLYSEGEGSCAVDNLGNVFLSGTTASASGISFNGHQNNFGGGTSDGFLVKFDGNGTRIWSTYYGGNLEDRIISVDVDNLGNVAVCGQTYGSLSNISFNGHQNIFGGSTDAFLVKFDNNGTRLWGTYYGGSNSETGHGVSTDNQGNIFLNGYTSSVNGIAFNGHQNTIGSPSSSDAFLVKFNSNGVRQWGTYYGGSALDASYYCSNDNLGNTYIVGKTRSNNNIASNGFQNNYTLGGLSGEDAFLVKFNSNGVRQWGTYYGGSGDDVGISVATDSFGGVFLGGYTLSTNSISTNNGHQTIFLGGPCDNFLAKFNQPRVNGIVWQDFNSNCIQETGENAFVTGIKILVQPGNYISESVDGIWSIDSLPPGSYSATIDTTNLFWQSTCPISQSFVVTSTSGFTSAPNFGMINNNPCINPEISVIAPFLRRCFSNQLVYIQACNLPTATGTMTSSYADVVLDEKLLINGASLPYSTIGINKYRFQLGTINPSQCVDFTISTTVSCNSVLFQSLCVEALLFPADSCVFDTTTVGGGANGSGGIGIPCNLQWDKSSLSVDGYCQNDSACFVIRNTGTPGGGDMVCYSQIRIYVDGVLTVIDSLQLAGGDSLVYCYYANGQTIRLEVDQHPLHPGNSHPNDVVELCGNPNNWTPGLVTSQPQDDADPVVDIYCGSVLGSYDPNDKMGHPIGLTNQHYIQPNQQLQYMIRFQNTGNDTAFTVVIRDTLDPNLNIFTVTPGVASHPYQFRMYGPRVLEWRFENIMLPDSNVNEPASNGFVTFHVEQNPNLPQGTIIRNDADIYFDFNAPVITNETEHQIYYGSPLGIEPEPQSLPNNWFEIYPNPASGTINIRTKLRTNESYQITDLQGRVLLTGKLRDTETTVAVDKLSRGVYILKLSESQHSAIFVKQ